ncbi:MAG: hypothetical protein AAFS07_09610 [Pseudomonadota bacterium]
MKTLEKTARSGSRAALVGALVGVMALAAAAPDALAKGGNDPFDRAERKRALQAERSQERNEGPSLFQRLFGADEQATTTSKTPVDAPASQ